MEFRYTPPAPEEWRAVFIQIAGSLLAFLLYSWWQALQPHFNIALFLGITFGLLYLLFRSAAHLNAKWRRSRAATIELTPDALLLRENGRETLVPWSRIKRCEAVETKVQITWTEGDTERSWSFSPREVADGQTLAREMRQRATPNFIALEAR